MPDGLREKGPSDRTRININEALGVELDISEDQLHAAIKAVGTRVKDLRKELGKNPAANFFARRL
jgi:hypothetical protein